WDIIKNKSYQAFDPVSSTVTSKVKGLGFVNNTNIQRALDSDFLIRNDEKYRLFDTADYIIPPTEYNSIFLMTNFVETVQTQSKCGEDYTKKTFHCKTDSDCIVSSSSYNNWHGIPTGKCIDSPLNGIKVCEISGWCPVEIETESTRNLIENIENFTIFIKNDIQFKKYGKKQRNILPNITNDYISSCKHDDKTDPYCPVFLVSEILEDAEPDLMERKQILQKGGVVQIEINWECNLDTDFKKCMPKYSFERFDLKFRDLTGASGFNFRFADKYAVNGTIYRTLIKAYGLRFIIVVTGKAGRFDFIPLLLTIGAGIGLLAIPTLIADFILLNLTKERKFYQKLKEYDYKSNENKEITMVEDRF
ncbi:unnamed protein product, partial [Brachionus calyciflorus]